MRAVVRFLSPCAFALGLAGGQAEENQTNPPRILRGHDRWVLSLAISPDSTCLASGSDDQALRIWNLGAESPPRILRRFESAVTALAFSKDGQRLAVGTWDGELMVCDAQSGKILLNLDEHKENINTIVFDPSGKYFASGSADDTLIVLDSIRCLAISPDDRLIVSGCNKEIRVWNLGDSGSKKRAEDAR